MLAFGCGQWPHFFNGEKQKIVHPGLCDLFVLRTDKLTAGKCLWLWLCCLCQLCPRMTCSSWTKGFEPVTFVLPTAIKHKCGSHQPSSHARRRTDWKLTWRLGVWVQDTHLGIARNFLKWKHKDNKFTTLIKTQVTHIFGWRVTHGVRAVRRHGPVPFMIPLPHFDPNS